MNRSLIRLTVFTFGLVAITAGLMEILLAVMGETLVVNRVIKFSGNFMLWRGIVLGSAGVFYVFALNTQTAVEARAQVTLASIMIWIVGGMEVLDIILSSIPGEGSRWISTAGNFVGNYLGPYNPAIFLLPLSIVLILVINRKTSKVEGEDG